MILRNIGRSPNNKHLFYWWILERFGRNTLIVIIIKLNHKCIWSILENSESVLQSDDCHSCWWLTGQSSESPGHCQNHSGHGHLWDEVLSVWEQYSPVHHSSSKKPKYYVYENILKIQYVIENYKLYVNHTKKKLNAVVGNSL